MIKPLEGIRVFTRERGKMSPYPIALFILSIVLSMLTTALVSFAMAYCQY